MTRMTRADVCFVLPGTARIPVGGYRVVYEYANLLAERGHAVKIVHMRMSHMRVRTPRELAVRLRYLLQRRRRPQWFDLDQRVAVLNLFRPGARALPPARTVIATSVATAPIVAAWAEQKGSHGLYFIQHVEDFTVPMAEVERTWHLPLLRVVVSSWLLDELRGRGLDAVLIENGVDRRVFRPSVEPGPAAGVLAMVSDQAFKRTDLVVELYRKVAADHPDLPLRTFGACDRPTGLPPSAEHIREPSREELATLYQRSALYVCASDSEGFGLPALEAMSSGCPVVTTDNGGVPGFAGDAVLTVPAGSAEQLVRGVTSLLADPELRDRYRIAGIERAKQLDAARSCDKLESLIGDDWRSQ